VNGPGDEEAKADFQDTRSLPDGSPLRLAGRYGSAALYGFGALDYLSDSTQSFGATAPNGTLARPRTPWGDNGRAVGTACGSRLGARLSTPEDRPVRGMVLAELGPSSDGSDPCQGIRVRHLYLGLRSPIADVLVGRYYGLVGWGGKGFLPNSAAFVAPPGQLYHLEWQARAAHIFRWRPIDIELVGALGLSPQRDPATVEPQLGLRVAVNGWRGAAAQGAGPPVAAPLQVGFSWARRTFDVNTFLANPTTQIPAAGDLWAFDLFGPLIPARGDDLSNAASLTLEMSFGEGFADWYPGLTGGVLFPALPSSMGRMDPTNPPPVYTPNLPPSIVTFDGDRRLNLIEWHAIVVGLTYHLPFQRGQRVWVAALVSRTRSNNAAALTPFPGLGGVWDDSRYAEVSVFVSVTSALQLAFSSQATQQTFGDGVVGRNARAQLSAAYFF
jgi:hypothetical protein